MRPVCDDGAVSVSSVSDFRRWSMLVIALSATLCANVFINGVAFLIPTLHSERGLDLAQAGLVSAMPSLGLVVTLIAWGYVVDRVGERLVLALGSALTAAAAFAAASAVAGASLSSSFCISLTSLLKMRNERPSPRAASGSFLEPNRMMTTTATMAQCQGLVNPM